MNNINIHNVESINIKTREIGDDSSFVTNLRVINRDGSEIVISLFSDDLNSLFPFDLQLKESI